MKNKPTLTQTLRHHLYLLPLLSCCLAAMAALPPHIIVLNNNDSGAGSFRAAVALANSSGNSGITFATNVTGTILLTNGGLVIASSTIINGPGATTLTIDGN